MQIKAVALSLFVALASADSLADLAAQIPSCAKSCIDDGAKQAGCASGDYNCECTNLTAITTNSITCISSNCSSDELQKTSDATTALCLQVAQQAGDDAYSSAYNSLTSATAAAGSATKSAGSAFTSATAAAGSSVSSALSSASPTATPGAANQAVAGMGMVGAAAMFALAL
ncbi:hypothetical protein F5Y01DRAFT_197320 [Xylaria sp. FL0043]|nr:hypothetical protein F5Y01DRAFT_197320 [Xylaria sp. FL0043]